MEVRHSDLNKERILEKILRCIKPLTFFFLIDLMHKILFKIKILTVYSVILA